METNYTYSWSPTCVAIKEKYFPKLGVGDPTKCMVGHTWHM